MMSKTPPSADRTAIRPPFSWSIEANFSGVTSSVNRRGGVGISRRSRLAAAVPASASAARRCIESPGRPRPFASPRPVAQSGTPMPAQRSAARPVDQGLAELAPALAGSTVVEALPVPRPSTASPTPQSPAPSPGWNGQFSSPYHLSHPAPSPGRGSALRQARRGPTPRSGVSRPTSTAAGQQQLHQPR